MLELPFDGRTKHGDIVIVHHGIDKFMPLDPEEYLTVQFDRIKAQAMSAGIRINMSHITDTREDIPEYAVAMQLPSGDYLFGVLA